MTGPSREDLEVVSHAVSEKSISEKIIGLQYFHPDFERELTVCVMKLNNGYVVIGKSRFAHPIHYSRDRGERGAFEDCIRQLTPLEGYVLREKLAPKETGEDHP